MLELLIGTVLVLIAWWTFHKKSLQIFFTSFYKYKLDSVAGFIVLGILFYIVHQSFKNSWHAYYVYYLLFFVFPSALIAIFFAAALTGKLHEFLTGAGFLSSIVLMTFIVKSDLADINTIALGILNIAFVISGVRNLPSNENK